jgi:integrase
MAEGSIIRRGRRSWRVKYDLPRDETGERRLAYVTVKGTRKDAEKERRRRLTALDKGMHVDPSALTMADWLAQWLDDVAPASVGEKSLERYRSLARLQIAPYIGTIQLQKLRPGDVAGWLQALSRTGLAPRTIRHAHGLLRAALGHACTIEVLERNVAATIRPPKVARAEVEIFDAGEVVEVLEKLKDHSIFPIAALALGTGARRGELAALTWGDVDLDAATIRIERALEQTVGRLAVKATKTKAGCRTISLPRFAVLALRDHRRETLELRLKVGAGTLPADHPVFGDLDGNWPSPQRITGR